jgi:hypothetical protein
MRIASRRGEWLSLIEDDVPDPDQRLPVRLSGTSLERNDEHHAGHAGDENFILAGTRCPYANDHTRGRYDAVVRPEDGARSQPIRSVQCRSL